MSLRSVAVDPRGPQMVLRAGRVLSPDPLPPGTCVAINGDEIVAGSSDSAIAESDVIAALDAAVRRDTVCPRRR